MTLSQLESVRAARLQLIDLGDEKTAKLLDWAVTEDHRSHGVTTLHRTAPSRIFLLVSDDKEDYDRAFPKDPHGDEVTWSEDQALDCYVEYVRREIAALSSPSSTVMDEKGEREAFEAWAEPLELDLSMSLGSKQYTDLHTDIAWQAWTAGRSVSNWSSPAYREGWNNALRAAEGKDPQ